MKRAITISSFLLLIFISFAVKGQTLRYFEFRTTCYDGRNNTWQDSSFIAATSNQVLIDTLYANLTRPVEMRYHIDGMVASGSGGYNHNADHWFLWHFIEDQWGIGPGGCIEIKDACPTGVDKNLKFFMAIGFCPWSSYVAGEVVISAIHENVLQDKFSIQPNPVGDILEVKTENSYLSEIIIYDIVSRKLIQQKFTEHITVHTDHLVKGIYVYELRNCNGVLGKGKIIKN
jgi:hypothetical protein